MISHVAAATVVARKELFEHFRSKRLFIVGGLYAVTFLLAGVVAPKVILGSATRDIEVTQVLGYYFGFGGSAFTTLLGVILMADAICGEWKDRSLFLLFSKPVSRSAVLAGKIIAGYAAVLLVFVSVLVAGVLVLSLTYKMPDATAWGRIFGGLAYAVVAILPFIGLGTICSCLFRTPISSFITAIGMQFLGFGILSTIGYLIVLSRGINDVATTQNIVFFFGLLNPSNLFHVTDTIFREGNDLLGQAAATTLGTAARSLQGIVAWNLGAVGAHTMIYLGLSFFIVRRRDYA
jgi:ABC-2 type transport system permease protein